MQTIDGELKYPLKLSNSRTESVVYDLIFSLTFHSHFIKLQSYNNYDLLITY